jgi:membrane-associated phospholipid phosphatase
MKHYTFVDYATQAYVLLVGGLILLFHNDTVPHWPRLLAIHAVILIVVHLLILAQARCAIAKPSALPLPASKASKVGLFKFLDFIRHFYPVLFYAWFYAESSLLNRMFVDQYLDAHVIRHEQALFGGQPGVTFMGHLPYLAVSEMFYAAYFSYYLMIGGVGLALFLRNRRQFFHYVSVMSFVFYVCYLTYIFVPVVGPNVFWRSIEGFSLPPEVAALGVGTPYPEAVQSGFFFAVMAAIYRVFETPGAALPSSHVAIAVCTVFFSFRYLRPIRYFHLAVAVLLCLATVYCHYHYGIDVIAGLITAAILIPLGNWLFGLSVRATTESDDTPNPVNTSSPPLAGRG